MQNIMLDNLRTFLGRLTSGVLVMGNLIWLLWPNPEWMLKPDALIAFISTFLLWLASISVPKHYSKHDAELFAKFNEIIRNDERMFLRDHDFGGSYNKNRVKGIIEIYETWTTASEEFDDTNAQAKFAEIRTAIATFVDFLVTHTYTVGVTDFMTPKCTLDEQTGILSQQTKANIKWLNTEARALGKLIEDFHRWFRLETSRAT